MVDSGVRKLDQVSVKRESGRELAAGELATGNLATSDIAAGKLGVEQQAALELMVSGKSLAETARSAGVSRMAIYRWMKHDPAFQAAYNQWRDHLRESCRSRLEALTDKATDALEKALEAGDARTALQLLKGLGLIKERAVGPTDVAEVKEDLAVEEKRRELKMRRERVRLMDEELRVDTGI